MSGPTDYLSRLRLLREARDISSTPQTGPVDVYSPIDSDPLEQAKTVRSELPVRVPAKTKPSMSVPGDVTTPPSLKTCGSCARWEALAVPLIHMGECSAGRRAHGWYDGNPSKPVEIQASCACMVHDGKGYWSRASGERYGTRPSAVVVR